jgi:DNA invertase Pin-like site-specific DNA recombinase
MRAYGYIRCSGISQMDGDGPERQRTAIEAYCREGDIEIVGWYVESHTGTDLEGRLEFRHMRDSMVSNGVKVVIVEKMDRLARSIMIQETILADFKNNGIVLYSATTGEDDLCGDDPTRVLMRQILACFFDYERKMIIGKLKAARQRIKKDGRRPGAKNYSPDPIVNKNAEGRKPFGQREGEQPILQTMLTLKGLGMSPKTIAMKMNAEGLTSRYGKPWRGSVISKILARERNKAG